MMAGADLRFVERGVPQREGAYRPSWPGAGPICERCWVRTGEVIPIGIVAVVAGQPIAVCPHGGGQ